MRPGDDVACYELRTLSDDVWMQSKFSRRIELADIIVHHHVGSDYPVAFAHTAVLAQHHKAVRVCVPDIYFSGLQPDITYLDSSRDLYFGPMGGYHSRIVLTEFLSGHSESSALASFESEQHYERLGYYGEFGKSADELIRRDSLCHIAGTPILMKYIQERPTLYCIDRPTNVIFKGIVTATFGHLGLDFDDVDPEYIPATMAQGCVWPPSRLIHAHHGLRFPPSRFMKTGGGAPRVLCLEDFVWESYQSYRKDKAKLLATQTVQELVEAMGLGGLSGEDPGLSVSTDEGGGPVASRHRMRNTLRDLASIVERAEFDPPFARNVANEVLWASPADCQILLDVSKILEALGDRTAGIAVLNGCISRLDQEPTLRCLCTDRLLELGATEQVGQELAALNRQKGLKLEDLEFVVRYARRLGKTGLALKAAMRMIHTTPHSAIPYARMAHVAMDAKQPGLAISAIEKALEYEPRNGHHFALRGYALESLGCRPAAIGDYEIAVSLDPDYADFRRTLERLREMMPA